MELNGIHVRRPLRFLNFGDPLHDELIEGWLPKDNGLVTLNVAFRRRPHPLVAWRSGTVSPQTVHRRSGSRAQGGWLGRAASRLGRSIAEVHALYT